MEAGIWLNSPFVFQNADPDPIQKPRSEIVPRWFPDIRSW